MQTERILSGIIPDDLDGQRLDRALTQMFPQYSRSRYQEWIGNDLVRVNGAPMKQKGRIKSGDVVEIEVVTEENQAWTAEPIPLCVIDEDDALLVIDKPAGLVVHPGAGNPGGTLLNALLHHYPSLAKVPRAGIIHRIDKDTSGLLVIAKTVASHTALVRQLQDRKFHRVYQAIVRGILPAGGTIEGDIGRHPSKRTRMAVISAGKPAITHYRVVKRYRAHSQLSVKLETGRTHQIRVHMAHIRHPIVGDPVYGGQVRFPAGISAPLRAVLASFRRQALHAAELGLTHPENGQEMRWHSKSPNDIQNLITALEEDVTASELEGGSR